MRLKTPAVLASFAAVSVLTACAGHHEPPPDPTQVYLHRVHSEIGADAAKALGSDGAWIDLGLSVCSAEDRGVSREDIIDAAAGEFPRGTAETLYTIVTTTPGFCEGASDGT